MILLVHGECMEDIEMVKTSWLVCQKLSFIIDITFSYKLIYIHQWGRKVQQTFKSTDCKQFPAQMYDDLQMY